MKMQRLIASAGILSLAILLLPSSVGGFSDVSESTDYNEAIKTLQDRGVIEGYADNTFKPENTLNRAEFLKIILEGRSDGETFTGSKCFPDVEDEWFAKYVCTAKTEGIINGYPDGTFRPNQRINFVEASKIISLAFGQDANETGGDWFEKYVRALESSRAIPTSIDNLEREIQRGEMVEMMWRLTDEKTDQPSKGYLNIKYPDVEIDFSVGTVQRAKSCADLSAFAKEAQSNNRYRYGDGEMILEMASDIGVNKQAVPAMTRAQSGGGNDDYSLTNVQVEGVDEADIVKTDGTYLYIIRSGKIRIVRAYPADEMAIISTIDLEDSEFYPQELYIDDDRLIVIGNSNRNMNDLAGSIIWPPAYQSQTEVRIYDVSNREKPKQIRKSSFDGFKVSSRKIGNKMYLVMNQGFSNIVQPLTNTSGEEILPTYRDSATSSNFVPVGRCSDIMILPHIPRPQYLIVAVIPTDNPNATVKIETVLGNGTNIYSSQKNLYIANTHYNYVWNPESGISEEKTSIYRFAFNDDGIELKDEGSVPGRILNQFSMDEHRGTFRIATTKGYSWNSATPSMNNLYILNMNLDTIGSIEDIAPGEQIYSVRFMGDRAYMVTFKKVDPLFVIDTSNPQNPKILGKLKIPGYSDYLHPYDKNHIIGFGKEAVESKDGNFAWYQGMKIALFDVSDVSNPKEKHNITIGDRGTESPLLHDHKALLFDKTRNLLVFPIRINELTDLQRKNNTDGAAYGQPVFQGAQVYNLTIDNGFQLLGQITHYDERDYLKAGSYFYGKDIERIVRISDSLISVSEIGIQSHTSDTVKKQNGIHYDGSILDNCPDFSQGDSFMVSEDQETCATAKIKCKKNMYSFNSEKCGCGCISN